MNKDLNFIGLTDKESTIYTTLLSLGNTTVQKIAEKTLIKRPTVYVHLATLLQKGYVTKKSIGKREYYNAETPKKIHDAFKNKLSDFEKNLAQLEYLFEKSNGKPGVVIYEGENGLNSVYEEIVKTKELRFWSDLASTERIFPNAVRKINLATVTHKIFTRDLIPNTKEAKESSKRWASTAGKIYTSRLATGPIFNDSVIFDNTVAFFRLEQRNLYVVKIEDPTIGPILTLYTCTPLWTAAQRFVVVAKLIATE